PRRVAGLHARRGHRACAGAREPAHRHGPLRRAHGAVGLGQVDAAASAGRARSARHGRGRRRRRAALRARRGRARDVAVAARRTRLPVLQPPAGALGDRERRAATPLDRSEAPRAARARRDRAPGRRPRGPGAPPAAAALRRRAAAGRDRARDRDRSGPPRRRRADGRPRREIRRGDPRPPPRAEPRLPEDDRHGDTRSARRPLRRRGRPARKGRAGERGRGVTWTGLVVRNLFRHPLRTLFTTLAIALAIFLVCAVLTLPAALQAIFDRAASNVRVSVHHKAGLVYWLPFAFVQKVRTLPGVTAVNHWTWFGGVYDEPKNMFPNFAVDPDNVGEMWPDYRIDAVALDRFRKVRNGAVVGDVTMRKFGWRVDQEVTLRGTIFPVDLTFRIVGVIPSTTGNAVILLFNRKYLEGAMEDHGGLKNVGMIWLR